MQEIKSVWWFHRLFSFVPQNGRLIPNEVFFFQEAGNGWNYQADIDAISRYEAPLLILSQVPNWATLVWWRKLRHQLQASPCMEWPMGQWCEKMIQDVKRYKVEVQSGPRCIIPVGYRFGLATSQCFSHSTPPFFRKDQPHPLPQCLQETLSSRISQYLACPSAWHPDPHSWAERPTAWYNSDDLGLVQPWLWTCFNILFPSSNFYSPISVHLWTLLENRNPEYHQLT